MKLVTQQHYDSEILCRKISKIFTLNLSGFRTFCCAKFRNDGSVQYDGSQQSHNNSVKSRISHRIGCIALLLITCLCFIPSHAKADDSPSDLIESTSNTIISELKQHPHITTQQAYDIIKHDVAPHIDFDGIARSALGRNEWQKATDAQRAQFTDAFGQLVMLTYAVALAQYKNESIQVLPDRHSDQSSHAVVKTHILRNGGPPLAVNYSLIRQDNMWKVYDFDVEGVSMLRSFRSQFQEALSKNPDLNQLIKTIQAQNQGKQKS